jgi:hypothetical protein
MIAEYAQSLAGGTTLASISLIVAVAAFVGIVVWALRLDRAHLGRMARLPLENDPTTDRHATEAQQ